MEVLLMKNGGLKMLITPDDVIDEKFIEALDGATCKLVTNQKVGDEIIITHGLVVEVILPKSKEIKTSRSIWNLFGLLKSA